MVLRRAFWYWQFAAALVLPLWVLTGYAIWGAGTTGFLGVAILAPLTVVAVLGLAAVNSARKSARTSRLLGWGDVALNATFSLAVIGAYWLAAIELAREVRIQVRTTLTALGVQQPLQPRDAGEYIVLPPPPAKQ